MSFYVTDGSTKGSDNSILFYCVFCCSVLFSVNSVSFTPQPERERETCRFLWVTVREREGERERERERERGRERERDLEKGMWIPVCLCERET